MNTGEVTLQISTTLPAAKPTEAETKQASPNRGTCVHLCTAA